MRPFRVASRVIDETLSLLFQPVCVICGQSGVSGPICEYCRPIQPIKGTLCPLCGDVVSKPVERCGACLTRGETALKQARSLLWLGEDAKPLVHRIKYAGRFELLDVFRPALTHLELEIPRETVLVPVPLHPAKLGARGFNQAELLAAWLAEELGTPTLRRGLEKRVMTAAQASLRREEREKNLKHSFQWRAKRSPPPVICLIDDIYTTGATLEACAGALLKAGAREVYAWTLFRTPLFLSRRERSSVTI